MAMNDNSPKTGLSGAPSSAFFIASWKSLEEGLTLMAGTPERERLVPETVSALRKAQAAGDPPSKLLLRVLAATAFLADDSPIRSERGEVGAMT
jgi:hypothetical protein